MGKDAQTPKTPDYLGAALAQGALSREAALSSTGLNRPNEVGPYGSRTWSRTAPAGNVIEGEFSTVSPATPRLPGNTTSSGRGAGFRQSAIGQSIFGARQDPRIDNLVQDSRDNTINPGDWTVTTTLTPEQQRIFDLNTDYRTNSGELAGRALENFASQGNFNYSPESFSGDRSKVEQALYDRATRLYGDQFGRDEEAFRTRLANQGLDENSEAFRRQVKDFETNRSNAYMDAADRAVLAGGQEQSRLLSNLLTARGAALNEAQGLAGGGQVQLPNFQGFGGGSAGEPADILGAVNSGYNAALGSANAQNASNNTAVQGATAIGSALLMYY